MIAPSLSVEVIDMDDQQSYDVYRGGGAAGLVPRSSWAGPAGRSPSPMPALRATLRPAHAGIDFPRRHAADGVAGDRPGRSRPLRRRADRRSRRGDRARLRRPSGRRSCPGDTASPARHGGRRRAPRHPRGGGALGSRSAALPLLPRMGSARPGDRRTRHPPAVGRARPAHPAVVERHRLLRPHR